LRLNGNALRSAPYLLGESIGGDFDTRLPQQILPAILVLSQKSVSSYQFLESATSSNLEPVIVF
ncbi:MAG: hypothetical protein JW896_18640, partial [Deltaproteobacteria bacterium]|nr:hypothetical protein [Deltaproteobacteria bacterium]